SGQTSVPRNPLVSSAPSRPGQHFPCRPAKSIHPPQTEYTVRQEMESPDIPIPPEEYPLLAFGITWLTDYVISDKYYRIEGKPACILLDEIPSMAGGESDLIYWWHKSIEYFPGLENRARIRMIQLAKE